MRHFFLAALAALGCVLAACTEEVPLGTLQFDASDEITIDASEDAEVIVDAAPVDAEVVVTRRATGDRVAATVRVPLAREEHEGAVRGLREGRN